MPAEENKAIFRRYVGAIPTPEQSEEAGPT